MKKILTIGAILAFCLFLAAIGVLCAVATYQTTEYMPDMSIILAGVLVAATFISIALYIASGVILDRDQF